jgi:hypothetical protein
MPKVNLQELLNSSAPVYVLNRTGRLRNGQTSTFMLTIKDAHGDAQAVAIPATKWPVDLSTMVPRKSLQDSKDLFRACRPGGPLEVIDPGKARAMLEDPMAQKSVDAALAKLDKTDGKRNAFKLDVQNANAGSQQAQVPNNMRGGDPEMASAPKLVVAKNEVSPRIKQAIAGLQNHPDTAENVWAMLAGVPDEELGMDDLGYIIKNAQPHVRIVKWAKNELAKRSAPDEDDATDPDDTVEENDAPVPRRKRHRH